MCSSILKYNFKRLIDIYIYLISFISLRNYVLWGLTKYLIFCRFISGNTLIGAIITGWNCFRVKAKVPTTRMMNKLITPRTIILLEQL